MGQLKLENNGITWWAITQFGHKKLAHVLHLATAGADSRLLQPVQYVAPKSAADADEVLLDEAVEADTEVTVAAIPLVLTIVSRSPAGTEKSEARLTPLLVPPGAEVPLLNWVLTWHTGQVTLSG